MAYILKLLLSVDVEIYIFTVQKKLPVAYPFSFWSQTLSRLFHDCLWCIFRTCLSEDTYCRQVRFHYTNRFVTHVWTKIRPKMQRITVTESAFQFVKLFKSSDFAQHKVFTLLALKLYHIPFTLHELKWCERIHVWSMMFFQIKTLLVLNQQTVT